MGRLRGVKPVGAAKVGIRLKRVQFSQRSLRHVCRVIRQLDSFGVRGAYILEMWAK